MYWKNAKYEMPLHSNPMGFVILVDNTDTPMLGQFDEESKRFMVYIHQIGKSLQVPVKYWLAIPMRSDGPGSKFPPIPQK